jgi:excinuclease ABC subunit C
VHRFGITFHRKKRSQGTFKNELEQIKGIGKNTAEQLLKEFKSVKRIKELSLEDLSAAVGTAKATLIKNYFDTPQPPAAGGEEEGDATLNHA